MIESVGRLLRLCATFLAQFLAWLGSLPFRLVGIFPYFKKHKKARRVFEGVVVAALLFLIAYSFLLAAPASFPVRTLVQVKKGATLEGVASDLKKRGIVNSATLFELAAHAYRSDGTVVAGEYAFESPQSILTVARRLTSGDFELEPIKVRVEEGMSGKQIADLLAKNLPDFDEAAFLAVASKEEGKLYPDTYFILPGEEPELIVSAMTGNFNEHIRQVQVSSAIASFGRPLGDVLAMASILEKEAATMQDRRIIAGILWHRLAIGMRLQVDTAPDTYKTTGLPAAPIGNPSVDAITAAVTPISTSYVYYLSDKDGVTHYSTTYDQHLQKKSIYLDN